MDHFHTPYHKRGTDDECRTAEGFRFQCLGCGSGSRVVVGASGSGVMFGAFEQNLSLQMASQSET